jgi:hypothetical protein
MEHRYMAACLGLGLCVDRIGSDTDGRLFQDVEFGAGVDAA